MTAPDPSHAPQASHSTDKYKHLLPYVVAATFFMEYLDTTIISTALPQMARTFGVGPNALSIGMTAYMLALAVFIPVSGWFADRFGSRTVFGGAIIVFTLSSILCAISDSVMAFTAARVLQGMGGAMMVPVGRLIVVRNTDKDKLMKAIATVIWPGIVAPVVGPPIGGFLTTYASWRWAFFLNVPFGLLALAAVAVMVRNDRGQGTARLDVIGLILSGISLTSIMFGTELASQQDASVLKALAYIAAGAVCGIFCYWHAMRHPRPLIDYTTLKIPTFSVTVITGSITRMGLSAVPYLLPLLFQIGFGMSAFKSGILLLVSATGNLSMKAMTTFILTRAGFRWVCIVDVILAALFVIACGYLTPQTPLVILVIVIVAYGLARSLQLSTLATLAYADIAPPQMNAASTLWSAAQQMALGMGIAFGAVALRLGAFLRGAQPVAGHTEFVLADFRVAFLLTGLVILASVLGYLRLAHDAGDQISGRMRRA